MVKQATDTFVATLGDGTERRVTKGEVFPDGHAIVKHAPGLFGEFENGTEEKAPAKRSAQAVARGSK